MSLSSGLAQSAPDPPATQPGRRGRRKGASLLAAHGEPMVWLTGGALAIALAMIVGLLLIILVEGAATFWPVGVVRFTTLDGQVYMGEVARDETYRPGDEVFDALEEEFKEKATASVAAEGGRAHRTLVRTGNFELSNSHFQWIQGFLVRQSDRPRWAVVVERLSDGRFYGFPDSFLVDDQSVADSPAHTWAMFQRHHEEVRRRWKTRRSLETHAIGRINSLLEEARLEVRQAELRHGADSSAAASARRRMEEVQAQADRDFTGIRRRIREINDENNRYQLVLSTADGQQTALALAEVVRAYPANQLSTFQRLGVYASRWAEFLLDDPRAGNSEGGVFPAIFGTVVMTLVMTVAVVPFGVLAALYLREYAKAGLVVSAVRIAINNLAGVPSIVFGVFGLGFFCYIMGHYIDAGPSAPWQPRSWFVLLGGLTVAAAAALIVSLLAGRAPASGRRLLGALAVGLWLACLALTVLALAKTPFFEGFFVARLPDPTYGKGGLLWASLTLALLTLPVVIVATEEALSAVPRSMREGSYACGASKWQTIWRIVLPRAMPGIMTGMILAIARGAGEVAPLMLVGAVNVAPKLPLDSEPPFLHPERSFMHLGFHVFDLGFQSPNSEAAKPMVFTTALLLILIIALLNIMAVWIRSRLRRRFMSSQF